MKTYLTLRQLTKDIVLMALSITKTSVMAAARVKSWLHHGCIMALWNHGINKGQVMALSWHCGIVVASSSHRCSKGRANLRTQDLPTVKGSSHGNIISASWHYGIIRASSSHQDMAAAKDKSTSGLQDCKRTVGGWKNSLWLMLILY